MNSMEALELLRFTLIVFSLSNCCLSKNLLILDTTKEQQLDAQPGDGLSFCLRAQMPLLHRLLLWELPRHMAAALRAELQESFSRGDPFFRSKAESLPMNF